MSNLFDGDAADGIALDDPNTVYDRDCHPNRGTSNHEHSPTATTAEERSHPSIEIQIPTEI
jgi:hypothetical protein